MKRMLCLLLAAVMCAAILPVMGMAATDENYPESVQGKKGVVFTNEYSQTISLDVKKTVSGDPAPAGDEFCFQLQLGTSEAALKPSGGRTYTMYNANNEEVKQFYRNTDSGTEKVIAAEAPGAGWAETVLRTDANGKFFLRDGYTASFEGIKYNTTYKVLEILEEMIPAELPADQQRGTYARSSKTPDQTGTLSVNGAQVTIENVYTKPTPDIPDFTAASLKVYKEIVRSDSFQFLSDKSSFPDEAAYNAYLLEMLGQFSFRLELDTEPVKLKEYSVYRMGSEDTPLSTGMTDSEGRFTIPGDCYAQFDDLESGKQFNVYEEAADGWWPVGENIAAGTDYVDSRLGVVGSEHARFANTRYSFSVTKTMNTGTEDELNSDFTFELTNANGTVLDGKYYLFKSNGMLLPDSSNPTGFDLSLHSTVAGRFTLKSGQTALFVNIPRDTHYGIREIPDSNYKQISPANTNGYVDQVVRDTIENKTFVNAQQDNSGLTVTKNVNDPGGQMDKNRTYKFILYKGDAAKPGEFYTVMENGTEYSRKTGDDGSFYLKAGQTARFTSLFRGNDYKVVEELSEADQKYFDLTKTACGVRLEDAPVDPAVTITASQYQIAGIPLENERATHVEVTNTVRTYAFRVTKTIEVDSRTAADKGQQGSTKDDNGQSALIRIEYLGNPAMNASAVQTAPVLRTFYTDIIFDGGALTGEQTVQTNLVGWYRISEATDWTATDYVPNYTANNYSGGVTGSNPNKEPVTAFRSEDGSCIYFRIEDEYVEEALPTANFFNVENPYAYRSGQAAVRNNISWIPQT